MSSSNNHPTHYRCVWTAFLLLLGIFAATANEPMFRWVSRGATNNTCAARNFAVDTQANIYIAGTLYASNGIYGSFTVTNRGENTADILLVKTDKDGNVLWAKTAGGINDDGSAAISTDDTNVFFAGNFIAETTFDQFTLIGHVTNRTQGLVAKMTPSGQVAWVKHIGNTNTTLTVDVEADRHGGCYVVGRFSRTLVLDSVTLTASSGLQTYLARYDTLGQLQWARAFGSTNSNEATAIAVDAEGGCVMTGPLTRPTLFESVTLTNRNTTDYFLLKYDGSGNLLWVQQGGTNYQNLSDSVAVDAAGNCYLSGYSRPFTFPSAQNGVWTPFVVKHDPSGNQMWIRNFPVQSSGDAGPRPATVAVDKWGNVIVTGTAAKAVDPQRVHDYFVADLNSSGTLEGFRVATEAMDAYNQGVAFDSHGNAYACGYFGGNTNRFGGAPTELAGGFSRADLFVARINPLPPILTVSAGAGLTFQWPTNKPTFVLESSTDFSAWSPETNVSGATQLTITNQLLGPHKFYRLMAP